MWPLKGRCLNLQDESHIKCQKVWRPYLNSSGDAPSRCLLFKSANWCLYNPSYIYIACQEYKKNLPLILIPNNIKKALFDQETLDTSSEHFLLTCVCMSDYKCEMNQN